MSASEDGGRERLLRVDLSGHIKEALPPPPAQGIVWILLPRLAGVALLPRPWKQDPDRTLLYHPKARSGGSVASTHIPAQKPLGG